MTGILNTVAVVLWTEYFISPVLVRVRIKRSRFSGAQLSQFQGAVLLIE